MGFVMRISTKGIYAIEAMTDLAIYAGDNVESIKNIATRRQLSEKYLEQIVTALRRSKLIISTRGAGGGYRLAKSPESITVFEILEAVENNMTFLDCLEDDADCGMCAEKCSTRPVWNTMWLKILEVLEGVTLADIVQKSKEIQKKKASEYYI